MTRNGDWRSGRACVFVRISARANTTFAHRSPLTDYCLSSPFLQLTYLARPRLSAVRSSIEIEIEMPQFEPLTELVA